MKRFLLTLLLSLFFATTASAQVTTTSPGSSTTVPEMSSNTWFRGAATPTDCSAPTFSFTGDTDTGIGYAAANSFKLCANGAAVATVGTTGLLFANLTAGRVGIVGTSGLLTDDADFLFNPTTNVLTAAGGFLSDNGLFDLSSQSGMLPAAPSITFYAGGSAKAQLTTAAFDVAANMAFSLASNAWIATAPSNPVACTSPTVTWSNGSAAFQIDVGTSCTGITTLVVTMPEVSNAYAGCEAVNVGASSNRQVRMTASTTTSVTFTNESALGTPADWADGADVRVGGCTGG